MCFLVKLVIFIILIIQFSLIAKMYKYIDELNEINKKEIDHILKASAILSSTVTIGSIIFL